MTIFELVKIALDQLYADGSAEHGDKLDKKIVASLKYLTESYGSLQDKNRKPVNYHDPAIRFAYVFKYVAAHGDYILQVLRKLRDALGGKIFLNQPVRVSCIGGGPGSEIIALIKYLNENTDVEPVQKVICYLLDSEQSWADIWTELDESLESSIKVNTNFQPFDVTKPKSWEAQKKFLQADIFIMSYFVSEVKSRDHDGSVSEFWQKLIEGAQLGSLFLYIDNGHTDFTNYFDNLCQSGNLNKIISSSNVRLTPSYSERKSELADYESKFGHSPKLQGQVSFRVFRKSEG
jgi:hypothetical protein